MRHKYEEGEEGNKEGLKRRRRKGKGEKKRKREKEKKKKKRKKLTARCRISHDDRQR
jgi:hypothetical protein